MHHQRPKEGVHEREPAPRRRRIDGIKASRQGHPALILGIASATKTLVEIAAAQPVGIEDLPERKNVTPQNLGFTVRRLVAAGLVSRYRRPEHEQRMVLTLNHEHPLHAELEALLRSIARANRVPWTPSPPPNPSLAVLEKTKVTDLKIFGRPQPDLETLFGTPNRTMAILTVATVGQVDASTIARICAVRTDGDMHRLLDPIEADGVFASKMVGQTRLYRLSEAPWRAALMKMCAAILRLEPEFASRVAPARILLVEGRHSSRAHLRGYLGVGPVQPQRKRRRRYGG